MPEEEKKILRRVQHEAGDGHADYLFWCPGCKCCHGVWVSGTNGVTGARWSFNGNMEKPTFSPSLLITSEKWDPPVTPENMEEYRRNPWQQTKKAHVCHSFVRDGQIQFLGDCTHALRGQTVAMEAF